MVKTIYELYPSDFKWKDTPYEYEYDRNPFDVIAGTKKIRKMIEEGKAIDEIKLSWKNDVKDFNELRERYFLY